jgi:hypothetical protein
MRYAARCAMGRIASVLHKTKTFRASDISADFLCTAIVPEPIARVEVAALLPPPPRQGAPVTRQSPAAYRGVFVLVRGSRTGPTRLHWTSVNRVVLDDGQADFQPTRTLIGRNNRPVCPVIRIAVGVPAWIGIAKTEGALSPRAPSTLSELKPRFTRPGLFP